MSEDERDTPVDVWNMHPELPKVEVKAKPRDVLEEILETVQGVLNESRDIKISAQRSCDLALKAFDRMPALEKRMNRVELIAIGAIVLNAAISVFAWFHH